MAIYIHKLTVQNKQYKLTIPKDLVKKTGIDKAMVVEIWATEGHIIHIQEYHGKETNK